MKKYTPEIKKKWLKALRSGDYDQGQDSLCEVVNNEAKYCCLGVLFEVMYGERAWEDPQWTKNELTAFDSDRVFVPKGLRNADILMNMNDGSVQFFNNPKTFLEIADWIEENT